jgi:hypothetical protein
LATLLALDVAANKGSERPPKAGMYGEQQHEPN